MADGRVDITPMLTHRFPLEDWREALRSLARPAESGALKVAFEPERRSSSGRSGPPGRSSSNRR